MSRIAVSSEGDGLGAASECVKLERGALVSGTIDVGATTVTLGDWLHKDGSEGELVGFSFTSPDGVYVIVKAGGEAYDGTGSPWANPNGLTGPEASAISHIVICDGEPSGCVDPSVCDGSGAPIGSDDETEDGFSGDGGSGGGGGGGGGGCVVNEYGEGCFDGNDNDCDGLADCDDSDCTLKCEEVGTPPPSID